MKWKVIIYKKENGTVPVKEFLLSLPSKQRAKAIWEIDLLAKYGTDLREPYVKALNGKRYKGLWEIRVKFASNNTRIIYFMPVGDTFVLLHGFLKKSNETSQRELEIARQYMNEYKGRFGKNG